MSSATFHYRFGQTLPAGGTAWQTKSVASIVPRTYLRVAVAGTDGRDGFNWYGLWRAATKLDDRQRFGAVGLEWLLAEPCRNMPYLDAAGSVRWAGRGMEFNAGGKPNRSSAKHPINGQLVYVFSDDPASGQWWCTEDAVNTVLAVASPKDANDAVIFNWQRSGMTALPLYDRPQLPTHGRSFLSLLQSLIPLYRIVGWRITGAENASGETDVTFKAFTFAETAIDIHRNDGTLLGKILSNDDPVTIACPDDQSAFDRLTTDASHVADQVVVTGDRPQIVFSLSNADSSIDKGWTAADHTTYLAGASGAVDYPAATEVRAREQRDRDARAAERLAHVYSRFVVPDAWSQKSGDGENGETLTAIAFEDDGTTQFKIPETLLAILPNLPLQTGYDYSGTNIDDYPDDVHAGEDLATTPHEPLPPLCFANMIDSAIWPSLTDRWQRIDRIGRAADLEKVDEDTNRRWSASVRAVAGEAAVEVRVRGEQQHVLDYASYNGLDDEIPGSLSWESLIFTVAIEDPRNVEVRYPTDANLTPLGEYVNRLRIEAPGHTTVEVRPNTVVDVDPETLDLERSNGGYIRDDRDQLAVIAQRAYQWHRTPRYALEFSTGYIDGALAVGQLVTQITDASGTYPVNTVISELSIDFPVTQGHRARPPRMTVATAFAELDAIRL